MRFSVFVLLLGCALAHAETFNDCIMDNMKGVGSSPEAMMVRQACRDKVLPFVPAKCNLKLNKLTTEELNKAGPFDSTEVVPIDLEQGKMDCINACLNASYWSKHFGDCAPQMVSTRFMAVGCHCAACCLMVSEIGVTFFSLSRIENRIFLTV